MMKRNIIHKVCEATESGSDDNRKRLTYDEFRNMCINNEVYKRANAICEKYGRRIYDAYTMNNGKDIVLSISCSSRGGQGYQPDIYYDNYDNNNINYRDEPYSFRIGTVSYGSLKLDDYKKFMQEVNNAYELCDELSKLDFTKLQSRDEYVTVW